MKILSPPEGEGLLTDIEVLEFLREKRKEEEKRGYRVENGTADGKGRKRGRRDTRMHPAIAELDQQVIAALEDGPAGLQSVRSVRMLTERLKKFNLAVCEEQMIANLRPDVLPRLLGIIEECNQRYTPEEIADMRQLIDCTLEKMPFDDEVEGEKQEEQELDRRGESLPPKSGSDVEIPWRNHSEDEQGEPNMAIDHDENDAGKPRISHGSTRGFEEGADYVEGVHTADGALQNNCVQEEQPRNRTEKETINGDDIQMNNCN